MFFLAITVALTAFAVPLFKSEVMPAGRIATSGFDGIGVLIGFVLTVCVAALTSPLFGFGFVFAALLHESSAALACRQLGHEVTRLRLVPLPFIAPPRTDQPFDHALQQSYVALFAPAIAILPMVISFALFRTLSSTLPQTADFFRAVAIMLGCFNFVVLLPFSPFSGGRIVAAVSSAFWPKLGLIVTLFMTAAFTAAALRDQSIAMGILAAAGMQSIFHKNNAPQSTLSPNDALLVMACYAFTLTVHFTGGYWLLKGLI